MRTTLDIPDELAGEVVATDPVTGLPVIHSPPDAPIHSMTVEQILALEQATLLEESETATSRH